MDRVFGFSERAHYRLQPSVDSTLNKLFGLRPSEIAEMEGMKGSSSVRQLIICVSDQLKAGEINLIDCTPQEATEAKERLETHRAKRRDRHNHNKD